MQPLKRITGEAHVADRYGLEEAIFLDAILFWYRTNRANARPEHFHDGRWWTYNSVKAFEEVFPWWNGGQIRRIVARCKEKGALLSGNFNENQLDRTAWYTPSDELLALYGERSGSETENCNCRKQQMQSPGPAEASDENGKCYIKNTCKTHVEQDMDPPIVPPEGDGAAPGALQEQEAPADKPKPKRTRRRKSAPTHDPEAFEIFWQKYPRKDSFDAAVRAWDKLKPDRELCRVMYAALKRQRSSCQWAEEGGRYIPLFSTWLNGGKWKDQGVDLSLLSPARRDDGGWAPDPEVD